MKHISGAKRVVFIAALCGLIWCANATGAAENDPQEAKLTIEKVALFKNGLGFISSGATLPENAKTVRFGQLPVPSYGTFWVGYSEKVGVRSLVTSMEELERSVPVQNMAQFLQANAGRKVTLRTGPGEKDVVSGVIMTGATEKDIPEPPSPYVMDALRRQDRYGRYAGVPSTTNILLIKTDKGTIALNAGSVMRADFEGGDVVHSAPAKQKRPSIRMELDRPAGGETVSVSYLARGVTWAPGYFIDLSDAETARFSARALVVNELADFENVKLDLVTGFPNIRFGEVSSPVAMSQNLAGFLNALAGGGREEAARGRGHMMTQQGFLSNVAVFDESAARPMPGYSTAAEGIVSEDLFLYPVKGFTLKKGETAWVPLFTAQMPYQHIYTWRIGDLLDGNARHRGEQQRTDGKVAEEVWHSCRLINNLKIPLTTATAEFVKEGEFTGQDVCYYTPPGVETTIRINRTMNVLAEQAETELQRTRNAAKFHGYSYDLVRVQGTLRLRSRLDKLIKVEVRKGLSGEVLKTSSEAKDFKTATGLKQVNPKHVLTWTVELKPGEEKELTFLYKVFVRD